jgi:asparagine synthase (glutamine-hydrolysing)
MCRIAGIFDPQLTQHPEALLRMRDSMRHGGPDDAGIYQDPTFPLILGHRRLSIIDLSPAGHQPMQELQSDCWIVFNGEIYNFQDLRASLQQLGHHFQSKTDTEVILKAYQQWGTEAFERFNGMFAFALLDRKQGALYLVRDHAGIKPLYYHQQGEQLIFASEVRAFKALKPDWPENPDWRSFFLSFGHLPEPVTTLKDVRPLEPGFYYHSDLYTRQGTLHRYQPERFSGPVIDQLEDAIAAVRQSLEQSVQRQLVSDVPLGLFLSGGLDSSVLTLAAQAILKDQLRTTSINFKEQAYSEQAFQEMVVQRCGSQHQPFTLGPDTFEEGFEDAMQAMDQPSNDGFNTYFVCKYARQSGLTVALSGLGADELLGGYPSFGYNRFVSPLRTIPGSILRQAKRARKQALKKVAFLSLPGPVGEYLFYRGLFLPDSVAHITGQQESRIWDLLTEFAENAPAMPETNGNRVSQIEQEYYMRNQLLKDTDAMSMWHSLEVRVPYLDKAFLQTMAQISPALKFQLPQKKELLVRAFQQELPEAVWKRPKMGFTFPFAEWFKHSERLLGAQNGLVPWRELFLSGKLSWARLWVLYLSTEPGLMHGWD